MLGVDKRILNFLVIIVLSLATFWWTFLIFHTPFHWQAVALVVGVRSLASLLIFKDYSLSWSRASQLTFLLKSVVYLAAFAVYMPFLYTKLPIALLASELFFYLFSINFAMYLYNYLVNQNNVTKTKQVVIFGAGKAGMKLEEEYRESEYKVKYFVDDDPILHKRSIDSIRILSPEQLKKRLGKTKLDLLVIAMPSAPKGRSKEIYGALSPYFHAVKVLPSLDEILRDKGFATQLKDISVEDLLARRPKDLDAKAIEQFVKNKKVLITGAGGSIGSEISRQCAKYGASKLVLLDHSEYNLYTIAETLQHHNPVLIMQSVANKALLENTFRVHQPDIVIHAAAYKHVPLVEENITEALINNIVGTKNVIDCAIAVGVQKCVLISTDKAVRPTNVMGATKRVCELYAQNINTPQNTEIVVVRFGNVLGSSGSVIPKFKAQIASGGPITVTHPEITRYFMLISEACALVLQAASIGKGGEIFILDMGTPVKIVDLAKKMVELSGKKEVQIVFTGLRSGEKLYEELLIEGSESATQYESITIASQTSYPIAKLNEDIEALLTCKEKVKKLKEIVPEFDHKP